MSATIACPCGRPRPYRTCCQPIHRGAAARSPEELMRSRYSAYALGRVEHLIATTTPGGPADRGDHAAWAEELREACARMRLLGLEVLEAPAPTGDSATVRFRFRAAAGGGVATYEERSLFHRRAGRWTYTGTAEPEATDG